MNVADLDFLFGVFDTSPAQVQAEDSLDSTGLRTGEAHSLPAPITSNDTHGHPQDDAASQPRSTVSRTQRKRRFAPRTRNGCLTCRARRKKCDVEQPVCRACVRVNAICQWPEKLDMPADGVPRTTGTLSDASSLSIPRSLNPNPRYGRHLDSSQVERERHLLSHYIHAVIPQTTIPLTSVNFFTSLYIPMAFQHTAVFDMVIASSASHMAKSSPDKEQADELRHFASQRRDLALGFIQKPLYLPDASDWTSSQLELMVVLLMAIGLDAQGGDRSLRWMQRVNCVRELLGVHQSLSAVAARTAWETKCVQQHLVYYDVMSLIMEETLDSFTRQDLAVKSGPFAHCSLTNPDVHCLFGLSEGLFNIMTHIRELPGLTSDSRDEEGFWKLHGKIANWRIDDSKGLKLEITDRIDLVTLAECHRLAALILLFRRWPAQHPQLPNLASQLLRIARRIDSDSPVATMLKPILFLAGAQVRCKEEMDLCEARLEDIRNATGADTSSAQKILQMIWEPRSDCESSTDWTVVLREQKCTINLG
ncbi:hypothetical protein CC79DRAFT_1277865 [Sarocladium strictum]